MATVNIDPNEVMEQNAQENKEVVRNNTEYDKKHYLNTYLEENETSKTITIRLLPFSPEGGTPFHKVHMHVMKVKNHFSKKGYTYKNIVCAKANGYSNECPICAVSEKANAMVKAAATKEEKKKFGDIAFQNSPRDQWIVRCIDRAHEDEGVKFWLFNSSYKKDGIYDKIINLFNQRWTSGQAKGKVDNIFDLNEGKDLILTITKDSNNKHAIQVVDDGDRSPLSNDPAKAEAWIKDPMKWDELYTLKDNDYLAIVLQNGEPYFDKDAKKWVNFEERQQISNAKPVTAAPATDVTAVPAGTVDVHAMAAEIEKEAAAAAQPVAQTPPPAPTPQPAPVVKQQPSPAPQASENAGLGELPF